MLPCWGGSSWHTQRLVLLAPRAVCAGTKSVVKLGNALDPVRVGTKFETQRDMLGLKLAMT